MRGDEKSSEKSSDEDSKLSDASSSSEGGSGVLSEEKLLLDVGEMQFHTLPLETRRELISEWRSRDLRLMKMSSYRFFQVTNFLGVYRVNQSGVVSLRLHDDVFRRDLSAKELEVVSSVQGIANPSWPAIEPPCDPSSIESIRKSESNCIDKVELQYGGGSVFHIIPKLIVLAASELDL